MTLRSKIGRRLDLVSAIVVMAAALPVAGCYGTTGYVETDDGAYATGEVDVDPSPAFIATTTPYYYGGRPNYWYGNRWRYRDGGRWGAYRQEPAPLRATRMQMGGGRGGFVQRGGGFHGGGPRGGGFRGGGAARGGRWR